MINVERCRPTDVDQLCRCVDRLIRCESSESSGVIEQLLRPDLTVAGTGIRISVQSLVSKVARLR